MVLLLLLRPIISTTAATITARVHVVIIIAVAVRAFLGIGMRPRVILMHTRRCGKGIVLARSFGGILGIGRTLLSLRVLSGAKGHDRCPLLPRSVRVLLGSHRSHPRPHSHPHAHAEGRIKRVAHRLPARGDGGGIAASDHSVRMHVTVLLLLLLHVFLFLLLVVVRRGRRGPRRRLNALGPHATRRRAS